MLRHELASGVDPDLGVRGDNNPYEGGSLRRRALHYLCASHGEAEDQIECFQLLLVHGADVYSMDAAGDTPLHLAVQERNTQLAAALIEAGANVHIESVPWVAYGQTKSACPLHVAARWGAVDCAVLLLEAGAAVNESNNCLMTPLEYAIFIGEGDSWGPGDPERVFGPIDVACTITIDRVGLLDDTRGPALTLTFYDGEELHITVANAGSIDRFIARPALCEYIPKKRPTPATDVGLVFVVNSPAYLLRLWPPFLNKVLYASDAGLRTFC